jgi:hypothetical protein
LTQKLNEKNNWGEIKKKTNQSRKQFKTKQIAIQKLSTKFENKFQKSND